jgi:hypothetical protein
MVAKRSRQVLKFAKILKRYGAYPTPAARDYRKRNRLATPARRDFGLRKEQQIRMVTNRIGEGQVPVRYGRS